MIIKKGDKDFVFLLCQRIIQPIGELYSSTISWEILHKIAYTNPRVLLGLDEEGKEVYTGIQRLLSVSRKKEISDYVVKDNSATFPSSIIINIPQQLVDVIPVSSQFKVVNSQDDQKDSFRNFDISESVEVEFPEMFIFVFPYKENVAQIIDGQHRMSGFDDCGENFRFDLPITIFVDQLIEKQAEIFSTINGKQTRVTPSLVYDLFGLSTKRSPYKVANEIVKLLNESESSPLRNGIRILGKANDYYAGYITQSTVVKNILLLYCGNVKQAEEDKRVLASGKTPTSTAAFTSKAPVFRDLFINEEDSVIFKSILNFFIAIERTFPLEWQNPNTVLKKTVGFSALFKVFIDIANKGITNNNLKVDYFESELKKSVPLDFSNIILSSKGINQLYSKFVK